MQLTLASHIKNSSFVAVHQLANDEFSINVRSKPKPSGALGDWAEYIMTVGEFQGFLQELNGNYAHFVAREGKSK